MARSGHSSSHSRSGGSPAVHPEHPADDDRPFAEIRRFLHDASRIVLLHRWAFFIPFCLASSTAFVFSLYSPRSYTAAVRFERHTDPVSMDLQRSEGAASFGYFRATMADDLKSERHMVDVVESLGLTEGFERDETGDLTESSIQRRNALARSLGQRLRIWTNAPSQYIDQVEITYTGPDPHIGRRLVEEVKKTYFRRSKEYVVERLREQRAYFARQLARAEEERDRTRRVETRLRLENPRFDPRNPGGVNQGLSQLDEARSTLLLRRDELRADLAAQRQFLATLEPQVAPAGGQANRGADVDGAASTSPEVNRLLQEIGRINIEIERLRSTRGMTLLHPDIVELADHRRGLETELETQRTADGHHAVANEPVHVEMTGAAPVAHAPTPQWPIHRAQALIRITSLENRIRDIEIELESNEVAHKELLELKQNILPKQEEFSEVIDRAVAAARKCTQLETTLASIEPVVEAAEQDRLVIFKEGPQARGSSLPIAPRAANIVVLSLLIGMAAGIACVVLAEVLDHVYRSSGHVARSLGLPILEAIDEIVTAHDRRRQLVNRLVITPLILACGLGVTCFTGSIAYLSVSRPATYEKLRRIPQTAIEFLAGDTERDPSPTPTDVS